MNEIALQVKQRPTGKTAARGLRRDGMVPGVFYTNGQEAISIAIEPLALRPIVYTSKTKVIDLSIEGVEGVHRCILKQVVFHPITDAITHFDLLGLTDGRKIRLEVPVRVVGQSVGVMTQGGILQQSMTKLRIECLPHQIPDVFEADVTPLGLGQFIAAGQIDLQGCTLLENPKAVIATILAPKVKAAGKG